MGSQYLYGLNPVVAALTARRRVFTRLLVAPPMEDKMHLIPLARDLVRIEHTTRSHIERFATNKPHQGVVLQASALPTRAISHDSTEGLPNDRVILCLDQVTDPQNFGAILRSACFLGVRSVVVTSKHSCPVTPAVAKVSSGAVEFMEVVEVGNLPALVRTCSQQGIATVAAAKGMSVAEWRQREKPTGKILLVLGSEGSGVRPSVLQECKYSLFIPGGHSTIDSLNVSCAATVLLHALLA